MKMNRKLLFGVALLSTLGLGGCAVDSAPDSSNQDSLVFSASPNPTMTFDEETDQSQSLTDNWVQLSDNSIELTLHGSSSCPPTVERVFKEETSTVKVELKEKNADIVCTMDYKPFYVTVFEAGDVEDVQLLLADGSLKVLVADGNNGELSRNVEPVIADSNVKLSWPKVEVRTVAAPKSEATLSFSPIPPVSPVVQETPASTPVARSESTPAPKPTPAPPLTGHDWIQATMAKYGVYPDAGTKFVIGPMPAGCENSHGCTEYYYNTATGERNSNYTITLLPGQMSEYLLLHEIAHARGIRDECAADNFTRSYLGPITGFYC